MNRSVTFAGVSLLCVGLSGVLAPAIQADTQAPSLLRYAFQRGLVFTARISDTNTETIEQPGYANRYYHEVITGLEQATTQQVYADGSALFRYHFADLLDSDGGAPKPVDASLYTITQAVSTDGHAEPATQQCSPYAGVDQFAPFTLTPLPPIPYADRPVSVGDSWTAALPPDDAVVSQARVRMTARAGASGSFQESATIPIHIVDPTVLGRITGTTVLTESVRQDLTTGAPMVWHLQLVTQVARTDVPLTPGKPVTLRIQSSQVVSAIAVPNAQFQTVRKQPAATTEASSTPVPTPDTHALPPAVAALARLNLGPTDVPACYHVSLSSAVTPGGQGVWLPARGSGFLYGHQVQLLWYPQLGRSLIVASVLRFADVPHAHAFLQQQSHQLQQPQDAPADLHGIQIGDERRFGYGEPYGPFDLALRDLQYNERYGEFDLLFRRGSYVVSLTLLGDFAPIDLGIYGQRIDARLQRAVAGGGVP